MSVLKVLSCGPSTSLQDRGRFGLQRYGVSPAGAMDPVALAAANVLVGNAPDAAGIEFCMLGGTFTVERDPALVAVIGAPLAVNGVAAPALTSVVVVPGDRLTVGAARGGVHACLAVAGGFLRPAEMGSLSVHRRSGIGGRPLAAGDELETGPQSRQPAPLTLPGLPPDGEGPFRVVLGPQDDLFTPEAVATFLGEPYTVSPRADRMGTRLIGPPLAHAKGFNIVSDGIVTGHVQVPGDGQPIVLMRDRQTTGGYPKIATLASADLARFAQQPPGRLVRFRAVSREEAVAALVDHRRAVAGILARVEPAAGTLTSERLLSVNLISGVEDAGGEATGSSAP
jgi:biotin-dependent carboxylase-like uncharacterized protein